MPSPWIPPLDLDLDAIERLDQLILTPEQASDLSKITQHFLNLLDQRLDPWLAHHDFPPDDARYKTAALLTIADVLVFMLIADGINPEDRLSALEEHCRMVARNLRDYHRDTER